jgi:hypothetical protein
MSYSPDAGLERLVYQYQHSPNVKALVAVLLAEYGTIAGVLAELRARLDIDASQGVQLDGIGDIVGRPRPQTVQIAPEEAFAFDGPDPGGGFSGIGRPDIGGQFVGINGLIVGAMPDEQYRVLIRAAIFANYTKSTLDNIAAYGRFVLGAEINVVEGIGWVDLSVGSPLAKWETDIIRATAPIAGGVRLGTITFGLGPGGFGFAGDDRNTGFGDEFGDGDGPGFVGIAA